MVNYPALWKTLRTIDGLQKLACSDELAVAQEASQLAARESDALVESLKTAGIEEAIVEAHNQKCRLGEKTAGSAEDTARAFQKLAVACTVDDVVSAQMEKLSGAALDEARQVRLLGREYMAHLMRGILA